MFQGTRSTSNESWNGNNGLQHGGNANSPRKHQYEWKIRSWWNLLCFCIIGDNLIRYYLITNLKIIIELWYCILRMKDRISIQKIIFDFCIFYSQIWKFYSCVMRKHWWIIDNDSAYKSCSISINLLQLGWKKLNIASNCYLI